MKYSLLVIDIDGTLIGRKGTISEIDRNAVIRAHSSGLKVSLSTGRVPQACTRTVKELGLDGCHIFFDGAFAGSLEGAEIYSRPLQKNLVKQAIEFARLNEIYLELYSASQYFIERETWGTTVHREFFGIVPTRVDFTGLWQKEKIIKGELFVASPEEEAQAKSFEVRFGNSLRFSWASTPAYPGVFFVNVVDPAVSKGTALEKLAAHYGMSVDEVLAVGDGLNDIPLLTAAGTAVAMGNAPDEVKSIADYVTGDVDEGGLAAALAKFMEWEQAN